ncbi:MAG: UDP-N-acetylmuramoyl-L-alanyl-D-glutamate--2,6-diaminopimelate ligase [Candidatus Cloacimonetes bacterium]|nr:UDP-N-acetylmuramoyl-L-alanyl-D-glutamate--2,6-diaminopimelate ligase [Candidatus Cloacimonadota bacterium]
MQDQSKSITLREVIDQLRSAGLFRTLRNISVDDYSLLVDYPVTDTRARRAMGEERIIRSFVCIRGSNFDGHRFVKQAIEDGIKLIICEQEDTENKIRQIVVSDTRKALALLAALYLNDPSADLFLIGVTGTNGKTSIVKIIENIMLKQGLSVATIGTLGYSINGEHYSLERTTPDITELNEILQKMRQEKIKFVVMEVSSHALKLDRVYGLKFNIAVFTNLTREHLDFHKDMEDYYQSKKKLFKYLKDKASVALINIDDPYGKKLYNEYQGAKYSISEQTEGDISFRVDKRDLSETIFNLDLTDKMFTDSIKDQKKSIKISTHLLGVHNAFNIAAAVTASKIAAPQLDLDRITTSLPTYIKGRLQKVANDHNISCYIDYAHTPDALKTVCSTLKSVLQGKNRDLSEFETKGRLITVIGAGGDRDKGKRKEMTNAILQHADYAIITSDNPRSENPLDIIIDLIGHLHPLSNYWIVVDREEAIRTAISLISKKDILLIAGKGHETYQELSSGKIPFDDYLISQDAISKRYEGAKGEGRRARERESDAPVSFCLSHSPASIRTSVPLDLIQVRLLLELNRDFDAYCSQQQKTNKNIMLYDNSSRIELLRSRGLTELNLTFQSVSTDTRTIGDNSLFFALRGENFDGHKYVSEALKFKNNWAVVDEDFEFEGVKNTLDSQRIIRVNNAQDAYSLLAKKYRSLFNVPIVAITGSSGKTTTKEYCYNILSIKSQPVLKNFANENNILGVSKTLFRLSSYQYMAIIEVGSNHFGEIQRLADICEPEIAIITNIGPSHLEFLQDLDGVFREKSALLKRDLWFALIPLHDPYFDDLPGNLLRIGFEEKGVKHHKNYIVKIIDLAQNNSRFVLNNESYKIASDLPFNILNAAFAVALAKNFGFERETIQSGLDLPVSLQDRMEIYYEKDRLIISDCYNANPISMKLAIDYWLLREKKEPHIAILGDMLELGNDSEKYHLEIRDHITDRSKHHQIVPQIITVGNLSKLYEGERHFKNVEALLASDLLAHLAKKAVILIKGSHSIHLEKIKGRL